MLFGGGLQIDGNHPSLGAPSEQRVNKFLDIFHDNPRPFRSRGAYVVCTGGYGLLAADIQPPTDRKYREGPLMANRLVEHGVPSELIRVEDESTSTLTNLTYSLRGGYIDIGDLSPESPLGLVSHPHHLRRIADIAHKLDIIDVRPIPTPEADNRKKEAILRATYQLVLCGAKGPGALKQRENLINQALITIRRYM